MNDNRRGLKRVACVILAAIGAGGCVSDGSPPAKANVRDLPPAASDVLPTVVDVNASRYAQDSDKNGYADMINATVFLFNPARYAGSLSCVGTFEFRLEQPDGKLIATWEIPREESAGARQQLLPGPGYMFKLTLLDKGGDDLDIAEGQLWCTFTPAEKGTRAVHSKSPIRVAIGRGR